MPRAPHRAKPGRCAGGIRQARWYRGNSGGDRRDHRDPGASSSWHVGAGRPAYRTERRGRQTSGLPQGEHRPRGNGRAPDPPINEFVFYDGPPFANGLPHYGHLLTGYVKDVVPRYQTMRGRRVERRFGWDCHGLPAEMEARRSSAQPDQGEILDLGIAKFNDACRNSVLRYTGEWRDYVTRQARWVDFDNDYKTMDLSYMESVMWAFKTLHEKGLVYEGFR
jgi:hypothetical protein